MKRLDQWFRQHLFVYLSLASSILILFVSVLHLCIFKEMGKKVTSLCIDTSEGLFFCSKQDQNLQKKREMEENVALSLALRHGVVRGSLL